MVVAIVKYASTACTAQCAACTAHIQQPGHRTAKRLKLDVWGCTDAAYKNMGAVWEVGVGRRVGHEPKVPIRFHDPLLSVCKTPNNVPTQGSQKIV